MVFSSRDVDFWISRVGNLGHTSFQVQRTVSCFWCLSVCVGRGVGFWLSGPRFLDFSGRKPCSYRFSGPTDRFLFLVFVCLRGSRGGFLALGTSIFGFLGSKTLSIQNLGLIRAFSVFPIICLSVRVVKRGGANFWFLIKKSLVGHLI